MFNILTGCTPGSGILHYAHGDSQQTHLLKQGKNVAFKHTLLLTFLILNIHFFKCVGRSSTCTGLSSGKRHSQEEDTQSIGPKVQRQSTN